MESLGYINSEGGPLLIVDGASAFALLGIESSDYDRARFLFDNSPELEGSEIDVGAAKGIVWEMRGAGTADVFKDSHSQILIVRSWLHDPQDSQGCLVLAEQPLNHPIPIGPLIADSMTIAILFAAETGQGFHLPTGIDVARQSGEISIDPGGLIVRTGRKRLNCFHDEVETSAGLARRIHILT